MHIAAASAGFGPIVASPDAALQVSPASGLASSLFEANQERDARHQKHPQDLTEDEESSDRPTPGPSSSRVDQRHLPAVLQISKHTHSAILYALEEALRHPNPFTSDIVEETASMSDLMTASGMPVMSNGKGPIVVTSAVRRPTAAPAPTSSPSGIRGPRMIMQERAAREARQRAEAEQLAMERSRAEQEARLLEDTRRRNAERRSAGVAARQGSNPESQQAPGAHQHGQAALGTSHAAQAPSQPPPSQQQQQQQQQQQPSSQQRPSYSSTNQQSPPRAYQGQGASHPQQQTSGTRPAETTVAHSAEAAKPRNSFPHAFERWETLSAHWEGLTSYWIRKLEQNKDDINRDPMSQQLARQVTDLSAAGANLFHAVVELQRLRASSERKFQRWFFETRAELERAQEVNAMLEAALEKERRDREQAIRDAVDHERGISKTQMQLVEMRKELAISKEEARRAWEELGRREQEERDRTFSLQSGHPTIVGGVQVVPMTQGAPSRHTSTQEHSSYQAGEYGQAYSREQAQASRSPPTAGGGGTAQAGSSRRAGGSEGGYSEGEYVIDAQGNFILDVHGNKIPFLAQPSTCSGSDLDAEDYDTPATTNPPSGGGHEAPTAGTPQGQWTGAYSNPAQGQGQGQGQDQGQDYSGQGYGTPGWETLPRHHHPTRLSDVIEEEDERSRTSASQMSRG